MLQEKIQKFKDKLEKEVCSDLPNAFWHRNQHIVDLSYISDFNEKQIPTKARPIQMNRELLEFCKNEIQNLLHKNLIRKKPLPLELCCLLCSEECRTRKRSPQIGHQV